MNKSLMVLGLGLCLAWPVPVAQAAGTETVQLKGHVPAVVSHLQDQGRLAATNLTLAIGLPLRNPEALTNLLRQINDPKSSIYHHYLTAAQFASLFGPSDQDYQAVADFARAHGLKVTGTHANHLLLDVNGLSTDIEKAFNVTFKTYKHPTENRDFFAPDTEPSVPSGLKVLDISGLSNYGRPRATYKARSVIATPNATSPATSPKGKPQNGSGPGGTYMGNDFRNAYIPGSALSGSGQAVAEVEFDGYYVSDIQEYEQLTGRNNITLQNTYLDGFNGQPTGDGGEVEVSLDIEMLVAMAPALTQINVYEGNPFNFIPNDVLNQIAADDSAHQISCSWGWEGLPTGTTDQIFQQMALQGQTFYTASGDSDAYPVGSLVFTPSDDPYVTSVGATTLTMNPQATARVSETVWNWDVEYGPIEDGVGSSGGISISYYIPYWQTNINMTAAQGSTTYRNFPDVAMTGDNVLVIADGGVEYNVGGTSCAAPLWAGFTAMVNQQESVYNNPPIGFINPALYNLALNPGYVSYFNDITTGSNTWSGSPNLFIAVPNYDLCTGLGTPNGTNLINALVTGQVFAFQVSPPPAPYGYALTSVNGGTPNGPWSLFIQDDDTLNSGILNNGWSIALTLGSPVGAEADLYLQMAALTTNIWPGSNVVFYVTVTNVGNMSIATNVVVADTLPNDFFYVSSSSTLPASTITRAGTQVIWQMGNLNTNAGGKLTITAQTANTTENAFNFAVVTEDTPDPNPDDNSAILGINVAVPAPPLVTGGFNRTNGYFTLNVTGYSGSTLIQASTNLLSTNWVTIWTTNASSFMYTDSRKTNYPARFFRAVAGQ